MKAITYTLILLFYIEWSSSFQLGNLFVSQSGALQTPSLLFPYMPEILRQAEEAPLADIRIGSHCHDRIKIAASSATKKFTMVPNTLRTTILEDGILIDASLQVYLNVPVYYQYRTDLKVACFKYTVCNWKSITMTGTYHPSIKLKVTSNPITIVPTITVPKSADFDWHGCHVPGGIIRHFLGDIDAKVQKQFEDFIHNVLIPRWTKILSIDQIVSPFPGFTLTYKVQKLDFQASRHIFANATAEAYVEKNATRHNFTPSVPGDGNIAPPLNWPEFPGNKALLAGLRLSSTVVEAFLWAANELGYFQTNATTPMLDTILKFNMKLSQPTVGFPAKNVVQTLISQGQISANCTNLEMTREATPFAMNFTNVNGDANITATTDKPGFIVQLTKVNLANATVIPIAPKIGLPSNLLDDIGAGVLDNGIAMVNSFMKDHPFYIDERIAPLLPNPQLELFPQSGAVNGTHGYLEFGTYCSCNTDSVWPKCVFVC